VTSCAEVRELFSDHADGLLAGVEEEALRRHVAGCVSCAGALARYEETVAALRGLAPAVPATLYGRIRTAAIREGLLPSRARWRWAWALPAAAAVVAALGYAVYEGFRPARRPAAPSLFAASRCAEPLWDAWMVDDAALRRPTPGRVRGAPLSAGGSTFLVPAALVSHGPYATDLAAAVRSDEEVCVPLVAPFGDVLVLSLAGTEAGPPSGFLLVTDPRRISYSTVIWRHAGLDWRIEGRASAAELLALAEEVRAGTRGPGT
jgi:anti-sigma factor RsiW